MRLLLAWASADVGFCQAALAADDDHLFVKNTTGTAIGTSLAGLLFGKRPPSPTSTRFPAATIAPAPASYPGQEPATGPPSRTDRYSPPAAPFLQLTHFAAWPMTSEQAAQLIDDTLDLVHQRLQELEAAEHQHDQKALAAEFREWRQPLGGHIDLMVCPGFPAV